MLRFSGSGECCRESASSSASVVEGHMLLGLVVSTALATAVVALVDYNQAIAEQNRRDREWLRAFQKQQRVSDQKFETRMRELDDQ